VIGPGDQLGVWALGLDDNLTKAMTVDPDGYIDVPLVGRIKAAGLSTKELKELLTARLRSYVKDPEVAVSVTDYHSQPVSVIGAIKEPGVRELRGGKRLLEVLAQAGGLTAEASNTIYVTRRKEWGPLIVPGLSSQDNVESATVKIPVSGLVQAGMPEYNIPIRPHDTVIVSRARLVYVMGEVNKPGGFVLSERESMSVLQALSLAGGTNRFAAIKNARILRSETGSTSRREIALDLKRILSSRSGDVELRPDDILFVPNSAAKSATLRALEAGVQITTGLIIWRK
jgi:polysaccharide export outer membrane protein